jgi:hypothetical protein
LFRFSLQNCFVAIKSFIFYSNKKYNEKQLRLIE